MTPTERDVFRPKFFKALLIAAARNGASFHEVNDWESCGVLVPPAKRVDGLSGLVLAAGKIIPTLFGLGYAGCKVCLTRRMSGAYADGGSVF